MQGRRATHHIATAAVLYTCVCRAKGVHMHTLSNIMSVRAHTLQDRRATHHAATAAVETSAMYTQVFCCMCISCSDGGIWKCGPWTANWRGIRPCVFIRGSSCTMRGKGALANRCYAFQGIHFAFTNRTISSANRVYIESLQIGMHK